MTELPSKLYGIQPGEYIWIKYPTKLIPDVIVNFNNEENTNDVYDICRDNDSLSDDHIIMNYPLKSCTPKYVNSSITLRVIGNGSENNPTKIERIIEFI